MPKCSLVTYEIPFPLRKTLLPALDGVGIFCPAFESQTVADAKYGRLIHTAPRTIGREEADPWPPHA